MEGDFFKNINYQITPPHRGGILISEPFLNDPNFFRSVILLTEHNQKGSTGLVLNKMSILDLDTVIDDFPIKNIPIYHGGPVGEDQLFFIHSLGEQIPGTIKILEGLYFGGDFDVVKNMLVSGLAQPEEFRFFIGYSGWEEEQLQDEIDEHSWIVTNTNASQIFNDSDDYWKDVMRSLGAKFEFLSKTPSNPSLN